MKIIGKIKSFFVKSHDTMQGGNNSQENPYLNARRTWNEHVGGVVSSRQTWQIIGIGSMLISLSAVAGMIHIGSQSKFIPFVVQVPETTHIPVFVGPVTQAGDVDPRVIQASVVSFIRNARLITPDRAVQRMAILDVYAMLLPETPAIIKMGEYLNGTPEQEHSTLAEIETQDIQITDVLPLSDTTIQIDWLETVRDRDGSPKEPPYKMRAVVTVAIIPPDASTSEEQVRANPLGVFVKDFSWSKQL